MTLSELRIEDEEDVLTADDIAHNEKVIKSMKLLFKAPRTIRSKDGKEVNAFEEHHDDMLFDVYFPITEQELASKIKAIFLEKYEIEDEVNGFTVKNLRGSSYWYLALHNEYVIWMKPYLKEF